MKKDISAKNRNTEFDVIIHPVICYVEDLEKCTHPGWKWREKRGVLSFSSVNFAQLIRKTIADIEGAYPDFPDPALYSRESVIYTTLLNEAVKSIKELLIKRYRRLKKDDPFSLKYKYTLSPAQKEYIVHLTKNNPKGSVNTSIFKSIVLRSEPNEKQTNKQKNKQNTKI